jgi:putative endonuclease
MQEKATRNGTPWTLLWSTCKQSRTDAMILEQKLKNLSRKRLIDFMSKYPEGIAGPDVPDRIVGKSGC